MRTAQARIPRLVGAGPDAGDRPVLLVTFFGVPFHPAACELAVGSAVEAGQPLTVANIVELPPLPMSVCLGHDHLDDPPEVEAALRAPAERARLLGVQVERLLVRSPRPIAALIQLASERRPGLLVLGPEPGRLSERFFRRARRAVREKTDCLVWSADCLQAIAYRRLLTRCDKTRRRFRLRSRSGRSVPGGPGRAGRRRP